MEADDPRNEPSSRTKRQIPEKGIGKEEEKKRRKRDSGAKSRPGMCLQNFFFPSAFIYLHFAWLVGCCSEWEVWRAEDGNDGEPSAEGQFGRLVSLNGKFESVVIPRTGTPPSFSLKSARSQCLVG